MKTSMWMRAPSQSMESPDNTGAERKMANREGEHDEDRDEADPDAIDEEMRDQDSNISCMSMISE